MRVGDRLLLSIFFLLANFNNIILFNFIIFNFDESGNDDQSINDEKIEDDILIDYCDSEKNIYIKEDMNIDE